MSIIQELPGLLKRGIRKYKVPGATLAVYRKGRVTETAAGVVNIDTQVKMTTDSVFQIGSISKIFTTTLIMQLVEKGTLDLDAPLKTYLKDFAVADAFTSRTVTLRHLLSHTSGIEGDVFIDSGRGDDSIANLLHMGRFLPQQYPLGERMSYCNFGFAMLGRLLEVTGGDTFDNIIRKRIFDPLRMHLALTLPEETLKYRCAIGHIPHPSKKGVMITTPRPWLSHGQKAAGTTPSMSVGNLMKFVDMHLRGGTARDGTRLLSRSSVRAMQRRQIKLVKNAYRGMSGWGLGWFLGDWQGSKVFGHDGGTFGQFAFLRIQPEREIAVALLTNGGDAGGLFDFIFENTFEPMAKVQAPQIPEASETLTMDPARIVGRYERLGGYVDITYSGNQFYIESTVKDPEMAGAPMKKTRIEFADKNTARFVTNDPILARNAITFEGGDKNRAGFLGSGLRLFPRVTSPD